MVTWLSLIHSFILWADGAASCPSSIPHFVGILLRSTTMTCCLRKLLIGLTSWESAEPVCGGHLILGTGLWTGSRLSFFDNELKITSPEHWDWISLKQLSQKIACCQTTTSFPLIVRAGSYNLCEALSQAGYYLKHTALNLQYQVVFKFCPSKMLLFLYQLYITSEALKEKMEFPVLWNSQEFNIRYSGNCNLLWKMNQWFRLGYYFIITCCNIVVSSNGG